MKLAIGLIKIKNNFILSCGPPDPIKKNSICYSIIEPTGSDISETAKKIKSEFQKITEGPSKSISLDEFVRVLPSGDSHIVETGKGNQFE